MRLALNNIRAGNGEPFSQVDNYSESQAQKIIEASGHMRQLDRALNKKNRTVILDTPPNTRETTMRLDSLAERLTNNGRNNSEKGKNIYLSYFNTVNLSLMCALH